MTVLFFTVSNRSSAMTKVVLCALVVAIAISNGFSKPVKFEGVPISAKPIASTPDPLPEIPLKPEDPVPPQIPKSECFPINDKVSSMSN